MIGKLLWKNQKKWSQKLVIMDSLQISGQLPIDHHCLKGLKVAKLNWAGKKKDLIILEAGNKFPSLHKAKDLQ